MERKKNRMNMETSMEELKGDLRHIFGQPKHECVNGYYRCIEYEVPDQLYLQGRESLNCMSKEEDRAPYGSHIETSYCIFCGYKPTG